MSDDYFEGILQLRNPNKEVEDYIVDSVNKKQKVQISNIKKVKGGVDFYFTSNKHLFRMGPELQNKFGGILKTSSKLHTRNKQSSKEVHRVNVLFRLMDYKVGDIVIVDKSIVLIKSMKKNITGLKLTDKKKIIFGYDDKVEVLKKFRTSVSKVNPHLEVLHPETFQSVQVMNEKKLPLGKNVKVVVKGNYVYLV